MLSILYIAYDRKKNGAKNGWAMTIDDNFDEGFKGISFNEIHTALTCFRYQGFKIYFNFC